MRYKKIMMLAILLVSLLAVSAVSAADNATSDVVGVENQDDDLILELDNSNIDDNVLNANPKTFNDLNNAINGNTKSDIYLNSDYTYNPDSDNFKEGININRAVTIHGNGHTINGNDGARIFRVSNSDVVLKDIIFSNGMSDGYSGGAICVDDGECSAVNCIFINNFAWQGGAISGECSAVNCTFENNTAVGILGHGGAMYGGSAVNCTFIDNSALGSGNGGAMYGGSAVNCTFIDNSVFYGANGGAMYDCSAVNCTFIGNAARNYGGAMYGECSAVNCTFTGNSAEYYGGAIYAAEYSEWTILDCTFINNHAQSAGAVYVGDGECSVVNCIFQNNNVSKFGGAIYVGKGECSSVDCTFISNSVIIGNGGAVVVDNGGVYSPVVCIFQYNTARHNGGAIYANGKCSAVNCTFINNDAGYPGGAIASGSAVNCTFINNSAVYWGGAISWGSAENCIFQYNYATESGGAMYEGSAENCLFQYNHAGKSGGAKYDGSAVNSIFQYNYADEFGGAISNGSADHCTFISNAAGINGSAMSGGSAAYCTYVNNCVYDVYTVYCTFITGVETDITVNDLTTVYGVSKKLVATLKDVDGNPLIGEKISIVLDDKEYSLKTNSKGKASLAIPTNLAPKTYVATITYAGNDEYAPSTATADVIVKKADTSISATINNNELVATLTHGVTGKAISGAKIVAKINGKDQSLKTDSKGQATFTADSSISAATVSYAGNAKYNPSSKTVGDVADKASISISVSKITVNYNDNSKLVATLTNSATGKVISGANVKINLNGIDTTIKTDSKGQAKISTNGLTPNTYTATISYAGNSKYNPASKTAEVVVNKATMGIYFMDTYVTYNSASPLVATLINSISWDFISGANVKVNFNGKETSLKSDYLGEVSIPTKGLNVGTYVVTVSYAGNAKYHPVSSSANLVVTKANVNIFANGDSNQFVSTLTNAASGKAISGANVKVNINGNEHSLKTDSKGQVKVSTKNLNTKTYTAVVSYAGNAKFNPVSTTINVDEDKMSTIISLDQYDDIGFAATLSNPTTGKTLSNAYVKFDLDGDVSTLKTESDGRAVLYDVLTSGSHEITVSYGGNSKYVPSSSTTTINNGKMNIIISSVYNEEKHELITTLMNGETGDAVIGANVEVNINGAVKNIKTNSKGQFTVSTSKLGKGACDVTIFYKGNSKYNPISAAFKVDI